MKKILHKLFIRRVPLGNPKGVLLTQKNVISQILSITKHFNFKSKERFITILPLFHNGGQFFFNIRFINFWIFKPDSKSKTGIYKFLALC